MTFDGKSLELTTPFTKDKY